MRSFVLCLVAASLAVASAAMMWLSMETAPSAGAGIRMLAHEVHGQSDQVANASDEVRTHARVAHGRHAASLDDGDDDVDDDADDFDVVSVDDDLEHPIGVTAVARPAESHADLAAASCALGPARGHASLPEHPPRDMAS